MTKKQAEGYYEVTALCKDDLRLVFKKNKFALKMIDNMDDADMTYLARKVGEAYTNDDFWQDLEIVFEMRYLDDKNEVKRLKV